MATKIGSEFAVNSTTSGKQVPGGVTALSNGHFVAGWYDTSGAGADTSVSALRAQIFDGDGDAVGSEFQLNTSASGEQGHERVTALGDGRFVATWSDWGSNGGGDSSSDAVRGQVFDSDGDKVGSEFLINTTTANSQMWPRATLLTNGNFLVTWDDYSASGGDTSGVAVRGQIFDPDGDKVGSEILVNATTSSNQQHSYVAGLAGGGFVAVYNDLSQSGGDISSYAIRARRFDGSGSAVGSEFLVNSTTSGAQQEASVAGLAGGGFVVVWEDHSSGTWSRDVKGRVFDASGSAVGGEFTVNTTTTDTQNHPEVAALPTGGFVVVWGDVHFNTGVSEYDTGEVRGQEFDADGDKVGSEFLVNTTTAGVQMNPHIAVFDDGRFVVAWRDNNDTGAVTTAWDGRAQLFIAENAVTPPELVSTAPADDAGDVAAAADIVLTFDEDVIAGTGSITIVNADDADDSRVLAADGAQVTFDGDTVTLDPAADLRIGERYYVLVGDEAVTDLLGTPFAGIADPTTFNFSIGPDEAEVVPGEDGDTHLGTTGADTVSAGAGTDTIVAGAGADSLDAGSGDDSVSAGPGNDTVAGGSGDDWIDGGAGADSMDGGSGADAIAGGSGNDTILGGLGDDSIDGGGGQDSIAGGNGADTILGGEGDDTIDGGAGDDSIIGAAGQDTVVAGSGDDSVDGDVGNDDLAGGLGSDVLIGGDGDDTLDGGNGDDSLSGGSGGDELVGGLGADTLNGGADDDDLYGGAGNDVFVLAAGCGDDTIHDYAADRDQVDLSAFAFADFAAVLAATAYAGGDSTIDLGGGHSVVLVGVTLSGADADSFVL
ncbi:MAG: Ig-like domain-containing protein [Rhodospirillales bacterium]